MTDWRKGLSTDQINAAKYIATHALLLAGPGTGKTKTLTRRALALVLEHGVAPDDILILTFTRVAKYQLKMEIYEALASLNKGYPYISTLHSFALRQLLRNSSKIATLPVPLRIADDWEERNIIFENLKTALSAILNYPIDKIKTLFNQLSADWETLKVELEEDQRMCRDGRFIGAWREHREIFGYTLRAELVYQIKKALEQIPDFNLESNFKYILVDEYQDLNSCDLALIEELAKKGGKLFVAGDDDQSIYGFRYANPIGIRVFSDKYKAKQFDLEICYRCGKKIIGLAEFVANLDYQRLAKKTRPRENAQEGEVRLLRFSNQYKEAEWIAKKCEEIITTNNQTSILILMRSDLRGVISKPIKNALDNQGIAVAIETVESPLDTEEGRKVLSLMRLIVDPRDSLAWYSLLYLERGIGQKTLNSISQIVKEKNYRFYNAIEEIKNNTNSSLPKKLIEKLGEIDQTLEKLKRTEDSIQEQIHNIIGSVVIESEKQKGIEDYLNQIMIETDAETFNDLLVSVSAAIENAEQELKKGIVNIMTMHKAKGLSSDVVFIVGAEKQFVPGKNIGQKAEDERRLLYVSLTRARHSLYITHCTKRIDSQRYTGSESGNLNRELTPFLVDSFLKPEEVS